MVNISWLTLIGIILISLSLPLLIVGYYNEKKAECISNPLVYASQFYEDKFGYPFQGSGSFVTGPRIQSPIFYFNKYNVTQELSYSYRSSGIVPLNLSNFSGLFKPIN